MGDKSRHAATRRDEWTNGPNNYGYKLVVCGAIIFVYSECCCLLT